VDGGGRTKYFVIKGGLRNYTYRRRPTASKESKAAKGPEFACALERE